MRDDLDDLDLEMDILPIPRQLAMTEELTEEMAASMAVIGAMFSRLMSAAEADLFTTQEANRFIALIRRINFLVAKAEKKLVIDV